MARTARNYNKRRGANRTGREAYEPNPEPTASSSEAEDKMNEAKDDPQKPGSIEEELEADAASGAWPDPVIPEVQARDTVVDYYHYTLGFNRTAALSLYMDQGLCESKHLIGIGNRDLVDKVCKLVRIKAKTSILLQAS